MGRGVKEEAKRLVKKFGSIEAIELCDYFKEGQIPKVYFYWDEIKNKIMNEELKEAQQAADELVKSYCFVVTNLKQATHCAILHTQGVINEIAYQAKSTGGRIFGKEYTNLRLKHHQQVLTILKTRL